MLVWDISNILIYAFFLINVPLRSAFAASQKIWILCVQFHCLEFFFFISLMIFLWPVSFSEVFCAVSIFVDFPAFLLLMSIFISLSSGKLVDILHFQCSISLVDILDFNLMNFAKTFFVAFHMIFRGECTICTRKEYVNCSMKYSVCVY